MSLDHFRDLSPDAHRRVQGCQGILKDERHIFSPDFTQIPLGHCKEIATTFQKHLAPGDAGVRASEQTENGPAGGRLAAATLSDNAEYFARLDVKADPIHGARPSGGPMEICDKVAN